MSQIGRKRYLASIARSKKIQEVLELDFLRYFYKKIISGAATNPVYLYGHIKESYPGRLPKGYSRQ